MRRIAAPLLLCLLPVAGVVAGGANWYGCRAATSRSALKYEDRASVRIAPFELMATPVTNAQFLAFVQANPQWRRGNAPKVFAEARYLQHWAGPLALGANAQPQQPVVNVSWFAADAYCKGAGRAPAGLERVGIRGRRRRARRTRAATRSGANASWPGTRVRPTPRCRAWGCRRRTPSACATSTGWCGNGPAIIRRCWSTPTTTNQGDPDRSKFCGAGALSMDDRENYAVLMQVAMLSSLDGADVTRNLGFRCARNAR